MTRTVYTLANGTRVMTMAEALASGMPYKVTYETIEKKYAGGGAILTERGQKIFNRASAQ